MKRLRGAEILALLLFALALSSAASAQPALVRVFIESASHADCSDSLFFGPPEIYWRVTIDGSELNPHAPIETPISQFLVAQSFSQVVDFSSGNVDIRIAQWDEDGGLTFDDDRCDISPDGDELDFTVDLSACSISGEVSGNCDETLVGDGDLHFRVSVAAPASAAVEFEPCWTTVGSAGAVDEDPDGVVNRGRTATPIFVPHDQAYLGNAVDQLEPFDGVVSIEPGAKSAHQSIRYNIGQFIEQGADIADKLVLRVRYLVRDKSHERVLVMLKRYAISTPVDNELGDVIGLFDSFDDGGVSAGFQTQEVVVNIPPDPVRGFLNHSDNAYYIDVLLIKYEKDQGPGQPSPSTGRVDPPAVAAVQLCLELNRIE